MIIKMMKMISTNLQLKNMKNKNVISLLFVCFLAVVGHRRFPTKHQCCWMLNK